MKPLTGIFLTAALTIAGAIGCDSSTSTTKPNQIATAETGSVTFFVEGMI